MENAKQKTIRLAYINLIGEEKYHNFKYDINFEDGTMKLNSKTKLPNNGAGFKFIATYIDYSIVIPAELIGIETNNGWIRIESEKDLPSKNGSYFVYSETNYSPYFRIDLFTGRLANSFENGKSCFTHYQPIVKPLKPIY